MSSLIGNKPNQISTNGDLGTLAFQDSNAVKITGGVIDGVTVGATTKAPVSATNVDYTGTLTGGTGVVNLGSGQFYKDVSGNVGIGVTPNTAYTANNYRALQLTNGAVLHGQAAGGTPLTGLSSNFYANAAGADTYIASGFATQYRQWNGVHSWLTAPSGTAGTAITFTQSLAVGKGTSLALEGATPKAGAGITFPATQSASTDANTLDDYEQGTFIPTISFGNGTTGITYSVQTGKYTKIGNQVSIVCYISLSNKGSSTGTMRLTGLPFTAVAGYFGSTSVWMDSFVGLSSSPMSYLGGNSSTAFLYYASTTSAVALSDTNFNNSTSIMYSATYFTAD